jgi:peroxiredoxin
MRRFGILSFVSAFLALAVPADAALDLGAPAPLFTLQASLGGKEFTFALADALKRGPVVLYFYPAAFTPGCTIEAHEFADAIDGFKKLGATVIGVSHDTIETLNRFSVSECQSKFPVAADADLSVARSYQAASAEAQRASRTSYVIAPGGQVIYTYTNAIPFDHVTNTMHAIEDWRAAQAAK